MNSSPIRRVPLSARGLLCAVGLFLSLFNFAHAQSGTGVITGTVSNSATGLFLKDALVELPELGRQTLTDGVGAFRLIDVPAGTHGWPRWVGVIEQLTFPLNVAAGIEARGLRPGFPKMIVSSESQALYDKIVAEMGGLFTRWHLSPGRDAA